MRPSSPAGSTVPTVMLTAYRRILATPGALLFSATGLVARLPISMVTLGIVLLVQGASGSYALAGSVSGAVLVANAVASIVQGRYLDRLGQDRMLPPLIITFGVALALLMLSVETDAPRWTTYATAVVTGLALPSVGACIRARWSHVLADPPLVQTAYALESVVDEAVFMLGPILVTVLATTWHPVAGLTVAIATGVGGTLFLAAQRATQPPPHVRSKTVADRPRIPWRVVAPLAVVALALGALFGSAEVTTVAFSEEHGAKGFTGVLLALWALGSLLAGVITGAIRWRRDTGYRLRVSTFALTCGMAPLALLDSMWLMGAFLFMAGFAIAPSLIATLSMIEQSVPAARLTEGMSIIHTGLAAGIAPGAALSGLVVDAAGASPAYLVSAGAGLVASLAAQTLPRRRPKVGKGALAPVSKP